MAERTKKIRPTVSNDRKGKDGVFKPEHLDTEKGKAAQMGGLLATWHCYQAAGGWMAKMDFSQVEDFFYNRNFEDGLHYQNMKYKKKGNYDRIRDMNEYRESVKTCPESTLYYLGDRYHNAGADMLRLAVVEFLAWREQEYPQVKTLDWALHIEDGAPHIHERHAWIAHDEAGNLIVSQEKALEEMGVPRSDEAKYQADMAAARKITDKKQRERRVSQINRYNNRKMTYSERCREKMIEIARSHGIEIEDKPREAGQKGLSQAKFKTQETRQKAQAWARYGRKMHDAANELKTAMQGDLEALGVQRAEANAKRFITALGGSVEAVRPPEAAVMQSDGSTPVRAALDAAVGRPGRSGADVPVRSALAQRLIGMTERRQAQDTKPGPASVEGPTV